MEQGVPLGMVCRRKVVLTDASDTGWGALCEGKPTFGHWSKAEDSLYINCLEMLAVCQACQTFLPDLRGHHVLVHSDSMTVVSYINRQGRLSSRRLFVLVERLLEWAQLNLRSLRAAHVPGKLNQGADMLSRSKVPSEEWMLHPQTVQKIWKIFGKAEVDLFASRQFSLPSLLFQGQGRIGPRLAQPPSLCFSPDRSDSTGNQANQGTGTQGSPGGPALEKPALVSRAVAVAHSSPMAHSPEAGSPLSGEQDDMAPPARAVGRASSIFSCPYSRPVGPAQVITLSALPPSEEDQELNLLCPVRELNVYIHPVQAV